MSMTTKAASKKTSVTTSTTKSVKAKDFYRGKNSFFKGIEYVLMIATTIVGIISFLTVSIFAIVVYTQIFSKGHTLNLIGHTDVIGNALKQVCISAVNTSKTSLDKLYSYTQDRAQHVIEEINNIFSKVGLHFKDGGAQQQPDNPFDGDKTCNTQTQYLEKTTNLTLDANQPAYGDSEIAGDDGGGSLEIKDDIPPQGFPHISLPSNYPLFSVNK